MKKFLFIIIAIFVGYSFYVNSQRPTTSAPIATTFEQSIAESDAILAKAFSNHQSNLQVFGQGIVVKILPDDKKGGHHQKFIIQLSSGQTLLVAHNIDIASRINSLQEGDSIRFYGEYEWNEKGGIVHWTHKDLKGFHLDGWLEHQEQKYW